MIPITSLVIFFTSIITTALLIPLFLAGAVRVALVRRNYRGELIPLAGGLIFAVVTGLTIGLGSGLRIFSAREGAIFLFMLAAATIVGLVDDVFGGAESKGFSGHFRKLFIEGELTTGGAKAIFGGLAALGAGYAIARGNLLVGALNGLLIALMMNSINLLDLRPGRAGKGFLIGFALLLLVARDRSTLPLFLPAIGSLLVYLPVDLKARVMMGDTGANLLGAFLGLFSAWSASLPVKLLILTALVGLMVFTEYNSLTETIEGNPVLDFLDRMGRDE